MFRYPFYKYPFKATMCSKLTLFCSMLLVFKCMLMVYCYLKDKETHAVFTAIQNSSAQPVFCARMQDKLSKPGTVG